MAPRCSSAGGRTCCRFPNQQRMTCVKVFADSCLLTFKAQTFQPNNINLCWDFRGDLFTKGFLLRRDVGYMQSMNVWETDCFPTVKAGLFWTNHQHGHWSMVCILSANHLGTDGWGTLLINSTPSANSRKLQSMYCVCNWVLDGILEQDSSIWIYWIACRDQIYLSPRE